MNAHAETYTPQCAAAASAAASLPAKEMKKATATRTRLAYAAWSACVLVIGLVVALIFAAPLLAARHHTLLALAVYQAFHTVCHQIPERSFLASNYALAVCARCTGIYVGLLIGVVCYPLIKRTLVGAFAPARKWIIVAAAPISVDWFLGVTGIWANTHTSRFLTGALFGFVAAMYLVPGIIECFASLATTRLANGKNQA